MTSHTQPSSFFGRLRRSMRTRCTPLLAELHANPRLQLGLAGIALLFVISGLMALDDARVAQRKQVETLYADNAQLRKQLGGEDRQRWLQGRLEAARTQVTHSQWQVSSPLMAQTLFSEWLTNELLETAAREIKVNQPTLRPINEGAEGADAPQDCASTECELLELRSTVRFVFDPERIARTLARVEQAEWPLKIDQLTIRPGERRVELTVKALARIAKTAQDDSTPPKQVAAAEPPAPVAPQAEPAPTTSAKKAVEIKW